MTYILVVLMAVVYLRFSLANSKRFGRFWVLRSALDTLAIMSLLPVAFGVAVIVVAACGLLWLLLSLIAVVLMIIELTITHR